VARKPTLKEDVQILWGISLAFLCIGSLLDLENGVWLGITAIAVITLAVTTAWLVLDFVRGRKQGLL
jgi:CHASE2 domain-containing sensor protein